MDCLDVFAGVTDFCENYTPDANKKAKTVVSAKENSSDSEAEELFTKTKRGKLKRATEPRKKPAKCKNKTNCTANVSEDEDYVPLDEENVLNEIFPSSQAETTSRRRSRRTTRDRTTNCSIEEYMQQQTERILAAVTAPAPTHNQRGRARRRYMANLAANATVTSVVDLAGPKTPPLPPFTLNKQTISVDSGDEGDFSFSNLEPANSSFDIENEEIRVKIKWGDQFEVIPLRKHQKFVDLLKELAKRKSVDIKDILLNLDNRIIQPDDTLDTINYNIAKFISGRIIDSQELYVPVNKKKKDPNMLKIKIQSNVFKKALEVKLRKDQTFKVLYAKCSEELKISIDSIKLSFDGDALNLNETPNDLEFEGGEMIDCRIVK